MHGAPLRLRCEHLTNPFGVNSTKPRLSWWINDPRPAEIQTAFQILAARSCEALNENRGDLWDSGRVEGRQTCWIEYAGTTPMAGCSVWWKVRSYDSDGLPSPWSDYAFFEAGLPDASAWQGQWIAAPLSGSKLTGVPVPLLTRQFEVTGSIRTARLYLAVLGQAALQINGTRVGADDLIPGWVDYRQRIEYQVFDVGDLLVEGANSIGVLLADGWYAGATHDEVRQRYGSKPALLLQLNLQLTDGKEISVVSDARWQWRPSWILSADPVRGESVDGRATQDDWVAKGEAELVWLPVVALPETAVEAVRLTPARAVAVRRLREISGELVAGDSVRSKGLYRFAQPMLGRARIGMMVPEGRVLRLRYGLDLDPHGALCGPMSEDLYTTQGLAAGEWFEATFSLHGFRYVELSGDLKAGEITTVDAVAIRQQLPVAGEFVSDHALLNRVFADIAGHQRRLAQSVPMCGLIAADRVGATAEFGEGVGTLLHNLDASSLCLKWLQDMADAQLVDGDFPRAVPPPPGSDLHCCASGAPHSNSFVEVLWHLYRHTGDLRGLQQFYPALRRYVNGLGQLSPQFFRPASAESTSDLPADLLGTAWSFHSAKLAARMAGVLGRLADLEDFEELASNVRAAFRRRFVTTEGRLVGDSLGAYALTLGFGLLESTERELAARHLFDRCEAVLADDGAIGLPAATQLLPTLTNLGRVDLAYKMLLTLESDRLIGSPEKPSAQYDVSRLIDAGVGDWIYRSVAGFDFSRDISEHHNAFRAMRIQPLPPLGGAFSGYGEGPPVRAVDAALDTINGRYELRWQITEDAFELNLLVPGNCEAEIILPDDTRYDVGAGLHSYTMPFGEAGDGIPILREVG